MVSNGLEISCENNLKHIVNTELNLNGKIIERIREFKYLGVTLDEHLNFESHINNIYNKACSKLGAIRKTRNCVGHSTALTLYKSLVLPHLDSLDAVIYTTSQ